MRYTKHLYAVVRVDEPRLADSPAEHFVTVKEIAESLAEAEGEVDRLNALNAAKGARYFWQTTRLLPASPQHDVLETSDASSEAAFSALLATIAEELRARVAFGDDPRTLDGASILSEMIADAVLDRFVVRERDVPRRRRTPR